MQPEATNATENIVIKTSARTSVWSALVGVAISLTNTIIQILMIYWILSAYGTEFNGFVRISMSIAIIGGTCEGALGITTVILMAKPIMEKDWITANESFSTAKRKYRNKLWRGLIFVTLISILYPLEIALAPHFLQGDPITTSITGPIIKDGMDPITIHLWELGFVCFFFGFKQVVSSSIFGIYENVLEADKQNYLRRAIILFTDVIVYMLIISLLSYINFKGIHISPVLVFLPIVIYPFIRGFMIMVYVKRKYPWIKFYSDFNDHNLVRKSSKLFFSSLGINTLMNADIIILLIVLGASGLKTTSMLSIYMIVGINIRIIMLNFIVSFREFFISQILREGRIEWKTYTNYELYTYIVAAFSFVMISILTPFVATGLFGNVIAKDFDGTEASAIYQAEALKYIFSGQEFSILFGLSTSAIIIVQGQYVLVQAKGIEKRTTKWLNLIATWYVVTEAITLVLLYFFAFNSGDKPNWIPNIIRYFYIIKLIFMMIAYFFLWSFTWTHITYNSSLKNVIPNFIFLLVPVISTSLFIKYGLSQFALIKINIATTEAGTISVIVDSISIPTIVSVLAITGITSLPICIILPLIFRPKIGLNIIVNLPIVKQIIQKNSSKLKIARFIDAGINAEEESNQNDQIMKSLYDQIEENNEIINDENYFEKRYKYKNTPKVYTLKPAETTVAKVKTKK
ncbi:putative transmembrane protein [Mesoplasma florum W37]|uniref:Polysaccharide transport protein, putative n=1 Tax=Mesoplasma florum TaxID=2151 RepID=A0AAD0HTQ7_MESFO|nr:hypothetical protein [Mesoplasma florum]AGY41676.1 putative transmembrane protein [Mesoplasma florum W37]AVN59880.1 hypothetical protein CG008_03215 [Mesoplasma florum]AVN66015.1 polysaccharide transport protein, putative [Mesoplasma florum]